MKRRLAVLAMVGLGVAAVCWRFFSSVRVQAFIRKHDDELAIGFGVVIAVVLATAVVIGLLWIRRNMGLAGMLAAAAFAMAIVAYAPAKVLPILQGEHSLGASLIVLGAGAFGSLVGILWIRRITSESTEPDPTTWRFRA